MASGPSASASMKPFSGQPYKCICCGYIAHLIREIRQHAIPHYPIELLDNSCDTCGQVFRTPIHLRKHVRINHSLEVEACDYCELRFTAEQKARLKHRLRSTQDILCEECVKAFPDDHIGSYTCVKCSEVFEHLSDWKDHQVEGCVKP